MGAAGYGCTTVGGHRYQTHRLVLEYFKGSPLPGMVARHHCDNPPCCNPDHLDWGCQSDNLIDRALRGRGPKSTPSVMTTFRLDRALRERIDEIAEERGCRRSDQIAHALRVYADSWDRARALDIDPEAKTRSMTLRPPRRAHVLIGERGDRHAI